MRPDVPLACITRGAFDALDDASLVRAVVEPVIGTVRGRSHAIKSAVYEALSPGRRALFAFAVLLGHAGAEGWSRFFREVPYVSELPDFSRALQHAFDYFGDAAMGALAGDVERLYVAHRSLLTKLPRRGEPAAELAAVADALGALDRRYRDFVAGSLARVAARIRERADEFVTLRIGPAVP